MTNNVQKIYREEPHCLGDDETTIVFAQNTTRIVVNKEEANTEYDDEISVNDNKATNEYERISLMLAPTFEGMIKEMMTLPENHSAWAYMNPTMYHLGSQTFYEDIIGKEDQYTRDSQNWFDGILFIDQELLQGQSKVNHLQTNAYGEIHQEVKLELKIENDETNNNEGSSSVEKTWGERTKKDNEESLRLWLTANLPRAKKRIEGDNSNLEEMKLCSICERDMHNLNLEINTCQECLQWIQRSTQNEDYESKNEKARMIKSQIDDETEFDRIPIAGENESDYEDSDEYEEEEDSILPYLEGEDNDDTNSTDTEDSVLQSVPIVIALSGPAQENNENEIKQTDTDTDDDSTIDETIATMFNETTNEQQQNASNETTSTFKTPEKRNTNPILELLRQATQKKLQLPTFDVGTAFLNESTLSVSTKKSNDIAFLVGPRRDGIIKSHTLSPIPLHDNTYQPLYIKDEEPLLTFQTNDTPPDQSASVDNNENDKHPNKKKRKKKTPDAITQDKRTNLDFDFSDEGYPLALFQFGGEQMKNDYETNRRSRAPSPTSSTDSKASLEIYYKALRTYPPEIDESNAESAERTKLIDQKINQLKQNRVKRKEEKQQNE